MILKPQENGVVVGVHPGYVVGGLFDGLVDSDRGRPQLVQMLVSEQLQLYEESEERENQASEFMSMFKRSPYIVPLNTSGHSHIYTHPPTHTRTWCFSSSVLNSFDTVLTM